MAMLAANARSLRRWQLCGLVCLAALILVSSLCWGRSVTTVVLVRHAEKVVGPNPVLTAEGRQRAEALVEVVSRAPVSAVYATNLCRTALTAEPLALELGVPIAVQTVSDAGGLEECGLTAPLTHLPEGIDSADALADAILAAHRGQVVVAVGHSNTVPALAEALGIASLCPATFSVVDGECRIPDDPERDEYSHLLVVEVPRWLGAPRLIQARYGEPS
jgi:phosphohistidine phosphatase SixA